MPLPSSQLAAQDAVAALLHEINNPLSTLVNAAYALSEEAAQTTSSRALAQTLRSEATRISKLADTLCLISRHQDFMCSSFDLTEVLNDLLLLATLEPGLHRQRKILADIPRSPMPVKGSAEQIQQVLWNLLINASKYGDGDIHLNVQTLRRHVRITMRNHCIDQAAQSSGMGIGLHLSSYILGRHRSALCFEKRDDFFESSFMLVRTRAPLPLAVDPEQSCAS